MTQRPANIVLEESFLDVRAKVLEIAAVLDRVDRALQEDTVLDEDISVRRDKIHDAIRLLLSEEPDRAERVQLLFSRKYSPAWRSELKVD